ncbi:hypothetical protein HMPREF2863_08990 [Micrococcus sp. HMSC067E09]|uniref:endonuclease NucS domain-containing protein n=1 Tax=Micrococcus sp. HMSC067E09 TaxID=1739367 RepID=UPI0008A2E74F|nr:endonuclease NucS domain-containing protein [Micrococcus sp. HMSC067E09]OFR89540.1 hypothetical protein HMPREF2863_08990 [Micrococcus sp. HMSC067E09]
MPVEMKMWRMGEGGMPQPLMHTRMPSEAELQRFLVEDPTLLGDPLLVIGREVPTPHGTRIDILAMDGEGNLHVLELKRDRTPREVVAQVLDYASWTGQLPREEIREIAARHLGRELETAFDETFGVPLPDELNEEQRLTIVASSLDSSSERIVAYLRTFGVPINAVFFTYLEDEDRRYLARSWLVSSEETTTATSSGNDRRKRAPWNGVDWYVAFDRGWEDARRYGFVSAGGGRFHTRTLRSVPEGARIWVHIPQAGYVGVGTTTGPAVRFDSAAVPTSDGVRRLADLPLVHDYPDARNQDDDETEWVLPVGWIDTRPESEAYWEKGMFGNQNSACKLRQEFTLARLAEHFDTDSDRSD